MTWELKNKIQEILAKETGVQCFAPGARRAFAFLYPNSYKVGMSNYLYLRFIVHLTAKRWLSTKEPKRR